MSTRFVALVCILTAQIIETNTRDAKYDMNAKPGELSCPVCGKTFKSTDSLIQHMKATKHDDKTETASNNDDLTEGNENDGSGRSDSSKNIRAYMDAIAKENIAMDKPGRTEATDAYSDIVKKILNYIQTLKNGKMYPTNFRKAGSVRLNTKIGKADEYDTNLDVKIDIKDVRTEGLLTYIYSDKESLDYSYSGPKPMNAARQLKDITNKPQRIPHGQAVVQVRYPSKLQQFTYNDDLIPYTLLLDLHEKVKLAIKDLGLSNVELSSSSHGPALTITIKRQHSNDISVDLVLTLPWSQPVNIHGWPRKNSRKVFNQNIVKDVEKKGLHLVPKGDETWTISYSKAEEELLANIDDGNQCRKEIMRFLKYYLDVCKTESADGLLGLSSYIIKIQILWSSENRRDPGYWHQKNKDTCLLDTIEDMVTSLQSGELHGYFDPNINILSQKRTSELTYFARCLQEQKQKLINAVKIKDEL